MIDITKKYQTRSGLPVRIYATDGGGERPVHFAAQNKDGTWTNFSATDEGYVSTHYRSPDDLIQAKTWRAWKEGEVPAVFMSRKKEGADDYSVRVMRSGAYSPKYFFTEFSWVHEDGSETPCGVCE
jgi:hypothetical protein